jgi:hypothetical protein
MQISSHLSLVTFTLVVDSMSFFLIIQRKVTEPTLLINLFPGPVVSPPKKTCLIIYRVYCRFDVCARREEGVKCVNFPNRSFIAYARKFSRTHDDD